MRKIICVVFLLEIAQKHKIKKTHGDIWVLAFDFLLRRHPRPADVVVVSLLETGGDTLRFTSISSHPAHTCS